MGNKVSGKKKATAAYIGDPGKRALARLPGKINPLNPVGDTVDECRPYNCATECSCTARPPVDIHKVIHSELTNMQKAVNAKFGDLLKIVNALKKQK